MRDETVARNYAETLFALANRAGAVDPYGEAIDLVAGLVDGNPEFRLFLETPRIAATAKKEVVRRVFGDVVPRPVLNFLLVTIDKRRQRLLDVIAREYRKLRDEHDGRAHVEVTLARAADDDTVAALAERLSDLLGVHAIPHVRVKPEILAGVMVRVGDTIYDGSLRRNLESMRKRLLTAELHTRAAPVAASD